MQNRRALTVGMVTLVMLVAFEATAVTAAMPTVARALDGLALYGFAFGGALAASVVAMVVAGPWCDRSGPARPIAAGVAVFCAGLVVAGAAPWMWVLVAGRLVQGFGGGLVTIALFVAVGRAYPTEEHPKVIAWISAGWVLPALFGPALAGLIVTAFGWRWVFLSVALAAVPVTALVLPRMRGLGSAAGAAPARIGRKALWALVTAAGLTLVSIGEGRPILLAVGLVAVVLTGPRLLPRGTFTARPGLPAIALVRGLAGAAFLQADVFIPLLLTRERGLSPTLAGLTLTAGAVCWSAGSWWQARQGQRFSDAARVRLGLAAIATGVASAMALVHPAVPVAVVLGGWALGGLGMGLVSPALSALVLRVSAPAEQGVNSSALQIADALLTTVALAVGGVVFAALIDTAAPAYLAAFGIALAMAAAGLSAAGRLTARTLVGDAAAPAPVALAGERAGAGRG